jgi:hypothetical protein
MTGFIVSVFPFRNRVSSKEAFEVLELGEGKLSRPVLRGPGGRKAAWLLGQVRYQDFTSPVTALSGPESRSGAEVLTVYPHACYSAPTEGPEQEGAAGIW